VCLKAIAMDAAGMAMSSCKKLINWLGSVDGIIIYGDIANMGFKKCTVEIKHQLCRHKLYRADEPVPGARNSSKDNFGVSVYTESSNRSKMPAD
jgi:hypothetical protein